MSFSSHSFLFPLVLFSHSFIFFFFTDTATTEIYTLSLHDALPIFRPGRLSRRVPPSMQNGRPTRKEDALAFLRLVHTDRKSTRLNSSHTVISYAVFCLKKKKKKKEQTNRQKNKK